MHPTDNGVYIRCKSMVDVRYQTGMHMKSAHILLHALATDTIEVCTHTASGTGTGTRLCIKVCTHTASGTHTASAHAVQVYSNTTGIGTGTFKTLPVFSKHYGRKIFEVFTVD